MKRVVKIAIVVLLAAIAAAGLARVTRAAQADKGKTTLTSFWQLPKEGDSLLLTIAGSGEPVKVAVTGDTGFGGVCIHCMLNQPFKVKEVKATCAVCGCAKTNAECIAWKDLKKSTWDEMLNAFPPGLAMRATFNTPDKPESGVKSFWVDHKAALIPVEGFEGKTAADLAPIVKAIGGGKAELVDGGKRLQIAFKNDYDADVCAKLLKAIEKAGGKVVKPVAAEATK